MIEPIFTLFDARLLAPELWVLLMSCAVLIVSLFSTRWTYYLAQFTLVFAAFLTALNFQLSAILFDGMFVSDPFACVFKLFIYLIVGWVFLYTQSSMRADSSQEPIEYYVLALLATLGMMVLASAAHFMSLFLGLEILSLPLYAMVALDRNSSLSAEASIKYFLTGALASALLLYGLSLLYGMTQGLAFINVAEKIAHLVPNENALLMVGLVFVLAGMLFKLGAAPFHMWVPDVYQGATTKVTLFVSSAPKIAAFAILLRFLYQALVAHAHMDMQGILIGVSLASMLIGNLVAIVQTNLKRLLAYSSIAHMGYLLLGLIAGNSDGYAAAIFYLFVYILMVVGAFGLLTLLACQGIFIENIADLQGLNARNRWLALMLLLVMFSMAGIPPLAGFFAKLGVLAALVQAHLVWLAAIALVFAIVGAYYYIAVVKVMYFEEPAHPSPIALPFHKHLAISINGLAILGLGLFPSALITICRQMLVGF